MALTGKVVPYKKGFGPFPPEVYNVAFPNTYHGVSSEESLKALRSLFKYTADPSSIAAIVIEPVQGEGGFNIAPFEFLRALRALCDQHGILLIADEIQTGFARTGRMFALEHAGIKADVVTMAKGSSRRTAPVGHHRPGRRHGCRAARRARRHLCRQPACVRLGPCGSRRDCRGAALRAREAIGKIIMERCRQLQSGSNLNCIGDVRGLGAMCAVELVKDAAGEPAPELTSALLKVANDNGLILLACGTSGNVIRFLVPLTASDALVREGMDLFAKSLAEAVNRTA